MLKVVTIRRLGDSSETEEFLVENEHFINEINVFRASVVKIGECYRLRYVLKDSNTHVYSTMTFQCPIDADKYLEYVGRPIPQKLEALLMEFLWNQTHQKD